MITQILITFLQNFERALTKNELMIRYIVLVVLLLVYLWLLVLILRRWKQKRMKTIIALILSAVLAFEAAQVFPFLHAEKEVPLEYVCSVKTTYNKPENAFFRSWYTNWSATGGLVEKESLERCLYCDLTDVELDDGYTYLFVYYYKDVKLFYSDWGESTAGTGIVNPKRVNVIWLGRLDTAGKATENTIYIYRFPQKAIVPYDTQWL